VWARSDFGGAAGASFVDLDVVVLDRDGHPVHGLHTADFVVKEDRQVAPILTADEIAIPSHESRLMAVVLDDLSVLPQGTLALQSVGRALLAPATGADRFAVVRLSEDRGEVLFGRLTDALLRIRTYVALGTLQPDEGVLMRWLDRVADLASQFGDVDGRRKTIVAVGNSRLLDPVEPWDRSRGGQWSKWTEAVARAAQANVALYVIDSAGLSSPRADAPDGLATVTGGNATPPWTSNRCFGRSGMTVRPTTCSRTSPSRRDACTRLTCRSSDRACACARDVCGVNDAWRVDLSTWTVTAPRTTTSPADWPRTTLWTLCQNNRRLTAEVVRVDAHWALRR
jgi:hypothetical protein